MDRLFDPPTSDPPAWESQLARERRTELEQARRLRDAGMRAAELNAHPGAKLDAEQVLHDLIAEGGKFTAETYRERLGGRIILATGPNAIGALIGAAARRGDIECVGVETATRPEAHARLIRVWKAKP